MHKTSLPLTSDFSKEQLLLEEKLLPLREQMETVQDAERDISNWLKLIRRHIEIEELDKIAVMELISCITVFEGNKMGGKGKRN